MSNEDVNHSEIGLGWSIRGTYPERIVEKIINFYTQ